MDDVDDEDQYGTAYMTHEDHIDESKEHLYYIYSFSLAIFLKSYVLHHRQYLSQYLGQDG